MINHPLNDVIAKANELLDKGGVVLYQKFTCANCGSRQTMDKPNKFYTEGICEECKATTDIQKDGCNFIAVFSKDKEALERLTRK